MQPFFLAWVVEGISISCDSLKENACVRHLNLLEAALHK